MTRRLCFSVLLLLCSMVCLNAYLHYNVDDNCPTEIKLPEFNEAAVILKLPKDLYTKEKNCYIKIYPPDRKHGILITVKKIKLDNSFFKGCRDYISVIQSNENVMDKVCKKPEKYYITQRKADVVYVTIHWESQITEKKELEVVFTSYKMGPCNASEFSCKEGNRCIRNEFKCDDYNNCGDDSDEDNCPISKLWAIIGGVIGGVIVICVIVAVICFLRRRRRTSVKKTTYTTTIPTAPVTHYPQNIPMNYAQNTPTNYPETATTYYPQTTPETATTYYPQNTTTNYLQTATTYHPQNAPTTYHPQNAPSNYYSDQGPPPYPN